MVSIRRIGCSVAKHGQLTSTNRNSDRLKTTDTFEIEGDKLVIGGEHRKG
jgi:hypothetical protein